MAKDDERPQFNPKHRIAGAVILVSLAVIFVPMLFEESKPSKENPVLTEIPARDAPVSETKVVVTPIAAPDAVPTGVAVPVSEKSDSEAPVPATARTEAPRVVEPKAAPAV